MPSIPFSKFGSTPNLLTIHQANPSSIGTTIIVVEGDDDEEVFRRWFPERQDVTFCSPPGLGAKEGGCPNVLSVVNGTLPTGLRVFGILDRDSLVSDHPGTFFEPDAAAFQAVRPFGPNVRILCRWELESYLVHPAAILEFMAMEFGDKKMTGVLEQDIVKAACEVADAVLYFTATNLTIRTNKLGESFVEAWEMHATDLATLSTKLDAAIPVQAGMPLASFEALRANLRVRMQPFHPNGSPTTWGDLEALFPVLDGKSFLLRLLQVLKLQNASAYKRGMAAMLTAPKFGGVPAEISGLVAALVNGP